MINQVVVLALFLGGECLISLLYELFQWGSQFVRKSVHAILTLQHDWSRDGKDFIVFNGFLIITAVMKFDFPDLS